MRGDGNGVNVVLGYDVVNFFPCVGQVSVGEGKEGGYGVVEGSGVAVVIGFAEEQFGEALHGCEYEHRLEGLVVFVLGADFLDVALEGGGEFVADGVGGFVELALLLYFWSDDDVVAIDQKNEVEEDA